MRAKSILLLALLALGPTMAQAQAPNPTESVRAALNSNEIERQRAALVLLPELGLRGERAWEATKAVTDFLNKSQDEENKALALVAIGKLTPSSEVSSNVLQKFLSDPSLKVRRAAGAMLTELLAGLARDFGKPLIITSGNPGSVSALAGSAGSSIWMKKWLAATVKEEPGWARFNDDTQILLPYCAIALTDQDDEIKQSGAEGIRIIARAIADVLPDPNSGNAESRVVDPFESKVKWLLLQPCFESLNSAAPLLSQGISSANAVTRSRSVRAAEAILQARALALATRQYPPEDFAELTTVNYPVDALKPAAMSVLPAVATRLSDESTELQLAAIESLEHQQSAALPYLKQILNASTHEDLFVRWVATRTLGRLLSFASPRQVPAIVSAIAVRLGDSDLDVRGAALTAIAKAGSNGRPATRALLDIAVKDDPNQRVQAIRTLPSIDAEREATLIALGGILAAAPDNVQRAALSYLASLGAAARPTVNQIRPLLLDDDADVRKEAARAILAIE